MFRGWGLSRCPHLHAIAKPFIWANWRGLESMLKMQLKLKKCGMIPSNVLRTETARCRCHDRILPMVAEAASRPSRHFERYDGKAIVMTGGERVAADIALLAIGFKLGVPFLPEAYRNKLVEPTANIGCTA